MASVIIKQLREFGFSLGAPGNYLDDYVKITGSSTSATLMIEGFPNFRVKLVGTALKYDADGHLKSGIATGITVEEKVGSKFVTALQASNFKIDITKALSDPNYNPLKDLSIDYDASAYTGSEGVWMIGTGLADKIRGSKYSDQLEGGLGNDVIYGGAGDDFLIGGGGRDKLYGEAGHDFFVVGAQAEHFSGGSGFDLIDHLDATRGVTANLSSPSNNTGYAAGDTYSSIEGLSGTGYADKLYGNSGDNILVGWGGNDTLQGGSGDDILMGGAGKDKLIGGSGIDTAAYEVRLPNGLSTGSSAGVTVDLSDASKNKGDAAGDTFSSIENVTGSSHADKIYGSSGNNVLDGGRGDDLLQGRNGNDHLIGGAGADDLYGGSGADRFIYKSIADSRGTTQDTIFDFRKSEGDRIDLSALDANTKVSGNDAFNFIGTAEFSNVAGQLRYVKQASDTYVYADVNGDGKADFIIHFDDAISLSKGDFLL